MLRKAMKINYFYRIAKVSTLNMVFYSSNFLRFFRNRRKLLDSFLVFNLIPAKNEYYFVLLFYFVRNYYNKLISKSIFCITWNCIKICFSIFQWRKKSKFMKVKFDLYNTIKKKVYEDIYMRVVCVLLPNKINFVHMLEYIYRVFS